MADNENNKDLCSLPGEDCIASNAPLANDNKVNGSIINSDNVSHSNDINAAANNKYPDNVDRNVATIDKDGALDYRPLSTNLKKELNKFFDPLTKKPSSCANISGFLEPDKSRPVGFREEIINKYSYEIVNLDPNNPWDIYYRDPDPKIWDQNRKANNNTTAKNIEELHFKIVDPIRTRMRMVFGDNVIIKVEYCLMSKAALVKYKLRENHIHSTGRAVVLRIENEKASMIYDDIVHWTSKDTNDSMMDYAKTEKEKELKPIDYGMLKLCNTESEDQFIYITLPFSKEELEKDELLVHNKSNFYYSEANVFKLAAEPTTATKLFPAYHPDNNVENLFNSVDDINEELENKNNEINTAIAKKYNKSYINQLRKEKAELLLKKQNTINPSDKPELEKQKEDLLNLLNQFNNDSELETKLNKINSLLNRYVDLEKDNIQQAIRKIKALEVTLPIQYNISEDFSDYFKAIKLYLLNLAIMHRKTESFSINEDEIQREINSAQEFYNSTLAKRKKELYQKEMNKLYPNNTK